MTLTPTREDITRRLEEPIPTEQVNTSSHSSLPFDVIHFCSFSLYALVLCSLLAFSYPSLGIEILQHVVDGKISWNFDPDSVKIDLGVYLEGKKTLQDEEDEEVVEEVIEGESEEDEDESEEEVKAVKKVPVKKQVKSESEEEEDSDESDDEVDEDDGGADYDNPFAVLGSQ